MTVNVSFNCWFTPDNFLPCFTQQQNFIVHLYGVKTRNIFLWKQAWLWMFLRCAEGRACVSFFSVFSVLLKKTSRWGASIVSGSMLPHTTNGIGNFLRNSRHLPTPTPYFHTQRLGWQSLLSWWFLSATSGYSISSCFLAPSLESSPVWLLF